MHLADDGVARDLANFAAITLARGLGPSHSRGGLAPRCAQASNLELLRRQPGGYARYMQHLRTSFR